MLLLLANSSMEEVMDDAYNYGRSWITSTLRQEEEEDTCLDI
jgi:hypothetical protein